MLPDQLKISIEEELSTRENKQVHINAFRAASGGCINNGGTINSTSGEVNLVASGIGNFTVTYTTTGPCPDTAVINLSITGCTLPTSGYTVSDDTICEGECIIFTDMSIGATSWQWTFNGGSSGSSTNQNPSTVCFNVAGTYIT